MRVLNGCAWLNPMRPCAQGVAERGAATARCTRVLQGQAQQAFGFVEQELEVREGLKSNILPAHAVLSVDQERGMQRGVLEIVKSTIGFERRKLLIRNQRKGHAVGQPALFDRLA